MAASAPRRVSVRARAGSKLDPLLRVHNSRWRDPAQVSSQWEAASVIDRRLLATRTTGAWWDVLGACDATLVVTREYEHLVVALSSRREDPWVTYMPLPHPSGVAVDLDAQRIHLASTRNPNQVFELGPVAGVLRRTDVRVDPPEDRPLVPVRSQFLPGCLYIHDLAVVGGELHATAVGENAVVRLPGDATYPRVWWPRCIETPVGPDFSKNYLQLNSIASGDNVRASYYSASTDRMSARRPGHRNFPVDGRGVIFSGETREAVARGLTRPHSARFQNDRLWVDNSGYGEVGVVESGTFEPVARLPGWTRGLCFADGIAFVGTSRVIPRFRQYAPGLDVDRSLCGIHAVEVKTGKVIGALVWPYGNQIFSVEVVPRAFSLGFPFVADRRRSTRIRELFYGFVSDH
jgi:uncharacterized protein (TIGR03032 family)